MSESFKMTDFYRMKLFELRLIEKQMQMDRSTKEEDLEDIRKTIKDIKKEYAKALNEEIEEEKEKGKAI